MDADLLKRFVELSDEEQSLTAKLAFNKSEKEKIEPLLREEFANQGIQNMRVNGRTVYLDHQVWASAKDGNHERLVTALLVLGFTDLVKPKINSQSLSGVVREYINTQKTEQPGMIFAPETALPSILAEAVQVSEVTKLKTRKSA